MGIINYERHRAVIEQLYEDTCTIQQYSLGEKDPKTRVIKGAWQDVIVDEPCYLDIKNHAAANPSETISTVSQSVVVILSPEVSIPEGSRLIVTKKGITRTFKVSGFPRVEGSHQEVVLELDDKA